MSLAVTDIAHHRNGVAGEGFYLAVCDWDGEQMLAIVPDEGVAGPSENGLQRCFVVSVDKLREGIVAFADNSYRAEDFYDTVAAAIKLEQAGEFVASGDTSPAARAALATFATGPRGRLSTLAG